VLAHEVNSVPEEDTLIFYSSMTHKGCSKTTEILMSAGDFVRTSISKLTGFITVQI
jgi:hypothetical protein